MSEAERALLMTVAKFLLAFAAWGSTSPDERTALRKAIDTAEAERKT